jgi:hypothetical protein
LSGRINRLENNFTQLNEEFKQSKMYTQYPLLEDGGPGGGGDQTLPPGEEEGEDLRIGIDEEDEQHNPQSRLSRSAPAKRWRATATAATAFNRKKDKLNQTAPPANNNNQSNSASNRPRTAENARRRPEPTSEFREFRQQKAKEKRYNSESHQPYVPATYQPDIEFVYKNEKGTLASAKVVSSPVEFSRQNNTNSPPNVPQYEMQSNTVRQLIFHLKIPFRFIILSFFFFFFLERSALSSS